MSTDTTMLTTAELANRWRTSVGRLSNDRCAGRGPAYVRIGASIRYPLFEVIEYESANKVEPWPDDYYG